ncbi:MAG: DUF4339 domain-containing protein [Bdellovibrionales bacterium]
MAESNWYYHDGSAPVGPMTQNQLEQKVLDGTVRPEHLVIKKRAS